MENRKQRFLLFGIGIGFMFVLIGLLADAFYENIEFYEIFQLYIQNPIHFLVLTAPFVLGAVGYFLGQNIDKQYFEINKLVSKEKKQSQQLLSFTKELNKGNVDSECELLKNDDEIGEALRTMKRNVQRNLKIEAKRKEDDKKQNWIVEGVAKFSELLRTKFESIDELGYNLISKLAVYTEAQQSAIYLVEESEEKGKYLNLLACFAYDRRKYIEREILFGEGLVGSCAVEEKAITLYDIPQNYIKISSGLGKSKPNTIILLPVKNQETMIGVIEIASLYKFEKHHVELIEKIAEITATTILNERNNEKTKKLLEDSNVKSEKLASQEEELRQTMEEMQVTKEESDKKRAELNGIVNAMNQAAFRVEYDLEGYVIDINEAYSNLFGFAKEKAIGLSIFDGVKDIDNMKETWSEILKGKSQQRINYIEMNNAKIWLSETYAPIYDNNGKIIKVLKLAFDLTEMKRQEAQIKKNEIEYQGQLEAINNSLITATFDLEGNYTEVNHKFELFAGLEKHEIIGKHHSVFMAEEMRNHKGYKNFWRHILDGKTKKGGHQYFFNNEEKWIYETFTAVRDEKGELSKVILLGNDITKIRENEKNLEEIIDNQKKISNP